MCRVGAALIYLRSAPAAERRAMSITAEAIVELFERDARARKRLAELLVSEPDVRLVIINAVLRDVATRSDVERIREEITKMRSEYATKEDIKMLRDEVAELRNEVAKIRGEYVTKGDIEKIRAEYATKGDVKALRDEVEKVKKGLAEVGDRVSRLEEAVSKLVEKVSGLEIRVASLDKRLDYVAKISWILILGVVAALIVNMVMVYLAGSTR